MTNIIDRQPTSVADLMNPQNRVNKLDASGLAIDWDPEMILAAANMQLPSALTLTKPGGKNETK